MIFAPPQVPETRYRPSYVEIANSDIRQQYAATECELILSREGSEYIREAIALIELDRTLEKLGSLSANWDSNGADKPAQTALANAASIGRAFIKKGLVPDALTPSSEGGVAICFMRNQKYADIECFNSGEVLAVRYSSTEDPYAWTIGTNAAAIDTTLQNFSKYLSA
jgi:hypothetical protein